MRCLKFILGFCCIAYFLSSDLKAQSGILSASGFFSNDDLSFVFSAGNPIVGEFGNSSISLVPVSVPDLVVIPTSTESLSEIPRVFDLSQNYPNPFNPSTIINYAVPKASDITIDVFDILGKKVASLVNQRQTAGNYSVQFNALNLASGVYIYTLRVNGKALKSEKMLLIK